MNSPASPHPPTEPDDWLTPRLKGYPHTAAPMRCGEIARAGWNVLAGDLPLPVAVLRRTPLEHNLAWMQTQVDRWGLDLAPHGKTTMSPQIFQRQLDAGAWGLTFATVAQLRIGVAAGVRRAIIANQLISTADLGGLLALRHQHPDLRVVFLVDSLEQLHLIERWAARLPDRPSAFEVLLEIGVTGGRTGCRSDAEALLLAERLHASAAVSLVGIECYEGLGAQGSTTADQTYARDLMDSVERVARQIDSQGWFEADEVLFSAGGSAIFDLVAGRLRPQLGRPVRGLLRSGCYVTHDHGFYRRMVHGVEERLGCACDSTLQPALEVWTHVQSRPEPGLAILAVGKRDISFDLAMPVPVLRASAGGGDRQAPPPTWRIAGLNDQHAYLRWEAGDEARAPGVGDLVGLGISHPCTTFDKWPWMPVVDDDYRVVDAVRIHF